MAHLYTTMVLRRTSVVNYAQPCQCSTNGIPRRPNVVMLSGSFHIFYIISHLSFSSRSLTSSSLTYIFLSPLPIPSLHLLFSLSRFFHLIISLSLSLYISSLTTPPPPSHPPTSSLYYRPPISHLHHISPISLTSLLIPLSDPSYLSSRLRPFT